MVPWRGNQATKTKDFPFWDTPLGPAKIIDAREEGHPVQNSGVGPPFPSSPLAYMMEEG